MTDKTKVTIIICVVCFFGAIGIVHSTLRQVAKPIISEGEREFRKALNKNTEVTIMGYEPVYGPEYFDSLIVAHRLSRDNLLKVCGL